MSEGFDERDARAQRQNSLSIVIPAYNEESNVERVYERLSEVMSGLGLEWELVFSVDPSTDRT
jgi:glycosyltransferase involved in cell wall biosynthesis